jgi:putative molybdopterin biosynthesis protein
MTPSIRNSLHRHRTARGWTQTQLGELAGITRQSYAAIESGRSVPSTEVALRLARALGLPVEELFILPPEEGGDLISVAPGLDTMAPGRIRLARVGGETLAFPLEPGGPHSGILADGVARAGGVRVARRDAAPGESVEPLSVQSLRPQQPPAELVLVGCDPAMGLLATLLGREHGLAVLWLPAGSHRALETLATGRAHVAGIHLPDPDGEGYNRGWVDRLVPFPTSRVRFATWEQCLVVASGNPLEIRGVRDLTRPGIRLLNREPGSGSRALLQLQCQAEGVPVEALAGFQDTAAPSHDAVGSAVAAGAADAGVAIRAIARSRGLEALTLAWEPFELAVPDHFRDLEAVQILLATLRRPLFQRQVEALGGYDTAGMGEPV